MGQPTIDNFGVTGGNIVGVATGGAGVEGAAVASGVTEVVSGVCPK